MTFNDGKKHEDLSKVRSCKPMAIPARAHLSQQQLLYVIHDILKPGQHKEGYLFLRLFRKFLELDVYMSFDVHTDVTLSTVESELKVFGELLLVISSSSLITIANKVVA